MSGHPESGHVDHGHGGGHGGGGGESSPVEKLPLVGRAVTMLKTIVSKDGLKDFLNKVAEWPIGVAMGSYGFIPELFGAKGGGGGGHGGGHGHH